MCKLAFLDLSWLRCPAVQHLRQGLYCLKWCSAVLLWDNEIWLEWLEIYFCIQFNDKVLGPPWFYKKSVMALPGICHGSERSPSGWNIASRIRRWLITPRAMMDCLQSHPHWWISLRAMTDSWQSHDGLFTEPWQSHDICFTDPGVLYLYFKTQTTRWKWSPIFF